MRNKQIADILYEFHAIADITLEDLAELISEEIPSVVRCKNCKYFEYMSTCTKNGIRISRVPNDYCSRGEKNE